MSQVMERVLDVLGLLAPQGRTTDWSPAELAERSGIPVQTVYRILHLLETKGWARRNPESRRYAVGYRLIQTGLSAWQHLSVRTVAKPVMEMLASRSGESVALTVRDGNDGLLIERVDSSHWLRLVEPIGLRTPLTLGAAKKVLLAFQDPFVQAQIIDELAVRPAAATSAVNRARLLEDLRAVRTQGYAISFGETTPGTAGVSAPIFDHGGSVVASITVAGPDDRFSHDRMPLLISLVRSAAEEVNAQLHGIPGDTEPEMTK